MIKRLLRAVSQEEPGFSGILAQCLKQEDTSLKAFAAIRYDEQGYTLVYNPDLLFALELPDQISIFLHEILHIVNFHHCRWADRDPKIWNLATDCAVNSLLLPRLSPSLKKQLVLPDRWELPNNKSAEWYYARLVSQETVEGVPEHPHWYILDARAAQQQALLMQGPSDIVWGMEDKKVDWRGLLLGKLRYHCTSKKAYSARRFSRRYGKPPGKRRQKIPATIVIAVDTSPSISFSDLETFFGQIRMIRKQLRTPVTVIECGERVEQEYPYTGTIKPPKRRGCITLYAPALERVKILHAKNKIGALVYFTDGDAHDGEALLPPPFPVMWVYPRQGCRKAAVWGSHLCLS